MLAQMVRSRLGLVLMLTLALCATIVADWLPPKTGGMVDSGGQNIGTLNVSSTGNVLNFNDNPNTSHPPDTSGAWGKDVASGGYSNGGGHHVYFEKNPDGSYSWVKLDDATGNVLDSGTYTPQNPT
jgi:hypothetical protein